MQSRLLAVHLDGRIEELARRTLEHAGAELDVVQSADEALESLRLWRYGVLVVNRDSIDPLLPVLAVVLPRPVVIVIGDEREPLDPELITMTVPAAYDPATLVGVVLACLNTGRFPLAPGAREGIGETC